MSRTFERSPDAERFVILGGGPCGLAAAWRLAKLGHRPIVIERESLVGGLCATHERNGFRFDLGGHRFVSSDADLSRSLEHLLGDDLLTQTRRSVVLHDGRAFRYPLEASDLVRNLGMRENLRALTGYVRSRVARQIIPRRDRTFEDWVESRFGRPLYDTFFGPYTKKLWGLEPSQISADWAAERISLLGLGDAVWRLLGIRRTPIRTYARRYRYPRYGMGQLYEAMADEIRRMGGELRMSSEVTSLETEGGRVVALHVRSGSESVRLPVRELLSTIPLPEISRLLKPNLPLALERSARSLRFRALVFLNIMLPQEYFSENTWMYVASKNLSMSRIQEPKHRSPWMAPKGQTSIMLEIPCDHGDATWRASTQELEERTRPELASLGFHTAGSLGAFSVRVAHGYPIYHLGYDSDRLALIDFVQTFSNVRTAGRQGLFRYVFMDAAMQMGMTAADQMMNGEISAAHIDAIGRSHEVIESRVLTA